MLILSEFFFIPLYLFYLGSECYGVIAFYTSVVTLLTFLEFGMGQTIVKELSQSKNLNLDRHVCNTVSSLESVYLAICLLSFLILKLNAETIGTKWLNIDEVDHNTITEIIQLIAIIAPIRFLSGVYRSGLIGSQSHLSLNIIEIIFVIAKGLVIIIIFEFYHSSLNLYFIVLLVSIILETFILRYKFLSRLAIPFFGFSFINFSELKRLIKFTSNYGIISLAGSFMSRIDMLLLPGLISIKEFGYYSVATLLGKSIPKVAYPVITTFRPKLINSVNNDSQYILTKNYQLAVSINALFVVPPSIFILVFSDKLLYFWTRDLHLSENYNIILSVLVFASMLNTLQFIPFSLQLAYSWLLPPLLINITLCILVVPCFYYFVKKYGVLYSAIIYLSINLIYTFLNIIILHTRYLKSEMLRWYKINTLMIIVCLLVNLFGYYCLNLVQNYSFLILIILFFISFLVSFYTIKRFINLK